MLHRLHLILFLLIISLNNNLRAESGNFKFGFANGFNISFFSYQLEYNLKIVQSSKLNYNALIYFDYHFSKSISLNAGVRYTKIAAKFKDNTRYPIEVNYNSLKYYNEYLLIPLKLKYYPSKKMLFYLSPGVEFGYLIYSELDAKGDGQKTFDLTKAFKKYNTFLTFGFGYKISYESFDIVLEAGYLKGINDILNYEHWNSIPYKEWKTNEFYFNLGVEI